MFKHGQKIIAIIDHSMGLFKKGDVFILKAVRPAKCGCHGCIVDIGIRGRANMMSCLRCKQTWPNNTNAYWFANNCFAALESKEEELMEAATEELVTI